jgi:hypothetical protein
MPPLENHTDAPLSPSKRRMRDRFAIAQQDAKNYDAGMEELNYLNVLTYAVVISEGEVVLWMSVRSPELVQFGHQLEERGYKTLSTLAFVVEEDLEAILDIQLKVWTTKQLNFSHTFA